MFVFADGTGRIHGVEISSHMVDLAFHNFIKEIRTGKMDISHVSVTKMPFNNSTIDRIFHCNCFHFWPRLEFALSEMYRVMKPGSFMVTTLDIDSIKKMKRYDFLNLGSSDLISYMHALETVGFQDVRIQYLTQPRKHQVIYAHIGDEKMDLSQLE